MANCFRLGTATLIRFHGADRCKVLNNLCTQDLRKLTNGQAAETFVTDVKGRTVSHGIAYALGNDAFFFTVPNQSERLCPHFERYIIREDAVITDCSQDVEFYLLKSIEDTALAFGLDMQVLRHQRAVQHMLDGESISVISAPWIGPESCVVLVPTGFQSKSAHERMAAAGDCIVSDFSTRAPWECDRIKAFWPWYGVDLDDRNLPQEIDRNQQAISFNKGCYLGQETIARLDALGQVQKKLVQVVIEATHTPTLETPLTFDGKEVGQLRSMAYDSAANNYAGLAYVKRSHFQPGQELFLGQNAVRII